MSSLGEVLERLHTAWDHLLSARGTLLLRYEPQRARQAYETWRHGINSDSTIALHTRIDITYQVGDTRDHGMGNVDQYLRFWMAKPWRWRVERLDRPGRTDADEPNQVFVIDGPVWWSWSRGDKVYTNSRSAHPQEHEHSGVDRALLVMLDPAPLLGTLRMELVDGTYDELGRPCDAVSGTARDLQVDPGLWPGAEQYRLLVDKQQGTLLRAEAISGSVFAATAFTELDLDQAIAEERFQFQVLPGVGVRYL